MNSEGQEKEILKAFPEKWADAQDSAGVKAGLAVFSKFNL